jgi:hypothetical protein
VLALERREEQASRGARRTRAVARTVTLRLRANETARAILLVEGRLAARTAFRPPGARSLRWDLRLGGTPLRPGRYSVALQARDRAGNLGTPTHRAAFRIVRAGRR